MKFFRSFLERLRAQRPARRATAAVAAAFALLFVSAVLPTEQEAPQGGAAVASRVAAGVGLAPTAAHADTWMCDYWFPTGFYCGKVSVTSNSRTGVSIMDHDGYTRYLPPGYHSRGSVYMRDVAKVLIPNGYCAEWYFAGVYRGLYGPGWHGIEDNGEYNQFKVRWC